MMIQFLIHFKLNSNAISFANKFVKSIHLRLINLRINQIKIIHKLRKKYNIKRYRNKVVVLAPTFVQIETKSVRIGQVVII